MANVPPFSKTPTGDLIQKLVDKAQGQGEIVQELNQRFMQIDLQRIEQVEHDLNEYEKAQTK